MGMCPSQAIPGGSDDKESACNTGDLVQSLGQEDPLEWGWPPTKVYLPGESHGQRSLVAYSLWGCKELDMTEWLTLPKSTHYWITLRQSAVLSLENPKTASVMCGWHSWLQPWEGSREQRSALHAEGSGLDRGILAWFPLRSSFSPPRFVFLAFQKSC